MEIELKNLGTINKNEVIIRNGGKRLSLYFSYETIVGATADTGLGKYLKKISVNDWSQTTGKFLNELEADKTQRYPHQEVVEMVAQVLKEVCK